MDNFLHAAVIGILAVIFAALLKKKNGELAVLLSLGACVLIALLLLDLLRPLLDFMTKLRNIAGLDKELLTPLLKTLGIGLLTQVCATVCADGGEKAVASLVEVCGGLLALYVALPLLEAVLDMVQKMSGGG